MYDGLLLDFYGTVVHEDGVVITEICHRILESATEPATVAEIGSFWSGVFSASCTASHGEDFLSQRFLERRSLAATVAHFGADCEADELAELQFAHWRDPPLFDDAARFLETVDLPIAVISNIDRYDIDAAMAANDLRFDHVITSGDVLSYKPRPELFGAGLDALGIEARSALHIGDSVTSDVVGATRLGIPVAWVNRSGRPQPSVATPNHTVSALTEIPNLL